MAIRLFEGVDLRESNGGSAGGCPCSSGAPETVEEVMQRPNHQQTGEYAMNFLKTLCCSGVALFCLSCQKAPEISTRQQPEERKTASGGSDNGKSRPAKITDIPTAADLESMDASFWYSKCGAFRDKFEVPRSHFASVLATLSSAQFVENRPKIAVFGKLWMVDKRGKEIMVSLGVGEDSELEFYVDDTFYRGESFSETNEALASAFAEYRQPQGSEKVNELPTASHIQAMRATLLWTVVETEIDEFEVRATHFANIMAGLSTGEVMELSRVICAIGRLWVVDKLGRRVWIGLYKTYDGGSAFQFNGELYRAGDLATLVEAIKKAHQDVEEKSP